MKQIQFKIINQLGTITLNRPEALNALTLEMTQQIYQQLAAWQNDPKVKAVLVSAVPGRAFCAGGDIRSLYEVTKEQGHPEFARQFFWDEYRLNQLIHHYPKPYIALLDGITMGGGVGISVYGSHRIATENLAFAMPEVGIGFFPDIGASYFLSRCPDNFGWYLALTGKVIDNTTAASLGLVNYTIKASSQEKLRADLERVDLQDNASSVINDVILNYQEKPEPLDKEFIDTVRAVFFPDSVEKIIERLQQLNSSWSRSTLDILLKRAPASVKVAFKQLQKGVELSLDDCLKMEYQLACNFLAAHDFMEGVRAAVVDKDRNPQWRPLLWSDVTDEMRDSYFRANYAALVF